MTLVEFLLARIAEDAERARHADWAMQGKWYAEADDKVDEYVRALSPARVLAECEAKRRIVTDIGVAVLDPVGVAWPEGYREALEHTLRLLALPYADHPDYEEAWRP